VSPPDAPPPANGAAPAMINIRNLSIKCGGCDTYQTLSGFSRRGQWNVYTYECENEVCDPAVTRTLLEVPAELDEFADRNPGWKGGSRHGC
jgi:hypothetical protein